MLVILTARSIPIFVFSISTVARVKLHTNWKNSTTYSIWVAYNPAAGTINSPIPRRYLLRSLTLVCTSFFHSSHHLVPSPFLPLFPTQSSISLLSPLFPLPHIPLPPALYYTPLPFIPGIITSTSFWYYRYPYATYPSSPVSPRTC